MNSSFFMGWLGYSKEKWRAAGFGLAIIGALGLFAPYAGILLISAPAAVFMLLAGLLINVGNA